jgi:hypothetical protein
MTTGLDPGEGRVSGTLPDRVPMAATGPAQTQPRAGLPPDPLSPADKTELARRVLTGLLETQIRNGS